MQQAGQHPYETAIHEFLVPVPAQELEKTIVSYRQNDVILIEKTVTGGTEYDETSSLISVGLSQEETALAVDRLSIQIQLNVITTEGRRIVSDPIMIRGGEQYHKEVAT
jgi:hypothetical protein